MSAFAERLAYEAPTVVEIGSVSDLTLQPDPPPGKNGAPNDSSQFINNFSDVE